MKKTVFMIMLLFIIQVNFAHASERTELPEKRTYKSKTFINDDGSYTTEISTGFLHYKTAGGEYKEINRNFVPFKGDGYDYMDTTGLYHVYLKSDLSRPNSVVFENKEGYQLKSALWAIGYLDTSTKKYKILQKIRPTTAKVSGSEMLFNNVFSGVDVKYRYKDTRLKEEIYFSQNARNRLPQPEKYGFNPENTLLVFITRLDFDQGRNISFHNRKNRKINRIRCYVSRRDITDTDFESENRVNFKDMAGDLKFFLPIDVAYPQSEQDSLIRASEIKVRKRIIRRKGKRFLLSRVPLTWIYNLAPGTIIVDPQVAVQPDATEGKDAIVRKSN